MAQSCAAKHRIRGSYDHQGKLTRFRSQLTCFSMLVSSKTRLTAILHISHALHCSMHRVPQGAMAMRPKYELRVGSPVSCSFHSDNKPRFKVPTNNEQPINDIEDIGRPRHLEPAIRTHPSPSEFATVSSLIHSAFHSYLICLTSPPSTTRGLLPRASNMEVRSKLCASGETRDSLVVASVLCTPLPCIFAAPLPGTRSAQWTPRDP